MTVMYSRVLRAGDFITESKHEAAPPQFNGAGPLVPKTLGSSELSVLGSSGD